MAPAATLCHIVREKFRISDHNGSKAKNIVPHLFRILRRLTFVLNSSPPLQSRPEKVSPCTMALFLNSFSKNVNIVSAMSAAIWIWNLDIDKMPLPVWMRRGLPPAHERIGTPMRASLE